MALESVKAEQIAALDFEPLLNDEDIDDLEAIAQRWGQHRRISLSVLGKSKAELVEAIASGGEPLANGFMEVCEASKDYRAHLAHLAEQAECMEARLLTALSAVSVAEEGQNA